MNVIKLVLGRTCRSGNVTYYILEGEHARRGICGTVNRLRKFEGNIKKIKEDTGMRVNFMGIVGWIPDSSAKARGEGRSMQRTCGKPSGGVLSYEKLRKHQAKAVDLRTGAECGGWRETGAAQLFCAASGGGRTGWPEAVPDLARLALDACGEGWGGSCSRFRSPLPTR
jgi:hypothetical protein